MTAGLQQVIREAALRDDPVAPLPIGPPPDQVVGMLVARAGRSRRARRLRWAAGMIAACLTIGTGTWVAIDQGRRERVANPPASAVPAPGWFHVRCADPLPLLPPPTRAVPLAGTARLADGSTVAVLEDGTCADLRGAGESGGSQGAVVPPALAPNGWTLAELRVPGPRSGFALRGLASGGGLAPDTVTHACGDDPGCPNLADVRWSRDAELAFIPLPDGADAAGWVAGLGPDRAGIMDSERGFRVPVVEDGFVAGLSGDALIGLRRAPNGEWRKVILNFASWLAETKALDDGERATAPTVTWQDDGPLTDGGRAVTGELSDVVLDPSGTRLAMTLPRGERREYVVGPLDGSSWQALDARVRPIPHPAWLDGVPLAAPADSTAVLVRADTAEPVASAPAGMSDLSLAQWILDK